LANLQIWLNYSLKLVGLAKNPNILLGLGGELLGITPKELILPYKNFKEKVLRLPKL